MKNKTIYAGVLATAFALTALVPATAADPSARISGSVGETVTEDASSQRLRYVGDPAPSSYTGNYQLGASVTTASPEDGPVTMSGTIDISAMNVTGRAGIIGLYDATALAAGDTSHKREAGIWVSYNGRNGGYYDIGVSDGDAGGGEWVQRFVRIKAVDLSDGVLPVTFVVDGTADPATCASASADIPSADGCMSLTVNGSTVTDSYGTVSPGGIDVELAGGAHPGWWTAWNGDIAGEGPDIELGYDLTVSPTVLVLGNKQQCKKGGFADFGFTNQGSCVSSLKASSRAGK